jgi:hypothetical protein
MMATYIVVDVRRKQLHPGVRFGYTRDPSNVAGTLLYRTRVVIVPELLPG